MSDEKTNELVSKWKETKERVSRLKSELNSAECAKNNAEIALAKWLTPADAKDGEKFSVWHYGCLIEIAYNRKMGEATIAERKSKQGAA